MRRSVRGAQVTLVSVVFAVLALGCSSEPTSTPGSVPDSAPTPALRSTPASNLNVSDAVPTLEDLNNMGIGTESAECFIATIDPEGTGRVASETLFMEAWASCL